MILLIKEFFNKLKERSIKYKLMIFIFICVYLFVLSICLIKLNKNVTTPGSITKVDSFIDVESDYEVGNIYTVSVYDTSHLSAFQYWISKLDSRSEIYDINDDYNDDYIQKQGEIDKQISITNSIIAAYNEAKRREYDVSIDTKYNGVIITAVGNNADKKIKLGQIIHGIKKASDTDFVLFENEMEFKTSLESIFTSADYNGENINLQLYTGMKDNIDQFNIIAIKPYLYENEYKIGINYEDSYQILNTSPKYELKQSLNIGPSGGLMQALSVYNAITPTDLTKGYSITGTGTIKASGDIHSIGGVYQKVFTASLYSSDIFIICNDETFNGYNYTNYSDAVKAYNTIKKPSFDTPIGVSTLSQAITAIENATNTLKGGN